MGPPEKARILAVLRAARILTDAGRPRQALACLRVAVDAMGRTWEASP